MPGLDSRYPFSYACRCRTQDVNRVQNLTGKSVAQKSPYFGMTDFAFARA